MRSFSWFVALGVVVAFGVLAGVSHQPPEKAHTDEAREREKESPNALRREHTLLTELCGEFDVKLKVHANATDEGTSAVGKASRQIVVGGQFMQETLDSNLGNAPFQLVSMLGFNADAKDGPVFELTRFSSAANATMQERGTFDNANKVFTFKGEHEMNGLLSRVRIVLQLESNDVHVMEVFTAYEGYAETLKDVRVIEFKAYSAEYHRVRAPSKAE
jgi:hypothetical protein